MKDRIELKQRIAGEIHLRDQPCGERGAEEGKVNVLWAPGVVVIFPRVSAGPHCDKTVAAVFVGESAAFAGEIRVERRVVLVIFVQVASGGVGLPNFNEGFADGAAIFVDDASADSDAFAERFTFVLAG